MKNMSICCWELQERGSLIEFYEMKEVSLEAYRRDANEQQKARYDVIGEQGVYQVYPEVASTTLKDSFYMLHLLLFSASG